MEYYSTLSLSLSHTYSHTHSLSRFQKVASKFSSLLPHPSENVIFVAKMKQHPRTVRRPGNSRSTVGPKTSQARSHPLPRPRATARPARPSKTAATTVDVSPCLLRTLARTHTHTHTHFLSLCLLIFVTEVLDISYTSRTLSHTHTHTLFLSTAQTSSANHSHSLSLAHSSISLTHKTYSHSSYLWI